MVANPRRRAQILDSALRILGSAGARALTHRAADAEAGLPVGTTANYFPSRGALLLGVAERAFDHLQPDPDVLAELADRRGPDTVADYVEYVLDRLLRRPELALALVELRLEAARNPDVAGVLAPFFRRGLAADVEFHTRRGLAGGRETVIAFHHAINGLVLDHLTVPLDPDADPRATARDLARRLSRSP